MTMRDGAVFFAKEWDTEKAKANNAMQQVFVNEYSNPVGWAQMKTRLEDLKYDVLQTSGAINTSLSTGSWVSGAIPSGCYTINAYSAGGINNQNFESTPFVSGTDWGSGAAGAGFSVQRDTGWAGRSGAAALTLQMVGFNVVGSCNAKQIINCGTGANSLSFLYGYNQINAGNGSVSVKLGGTTIYSEYLAAGSAAVTKKILDITAYTGSNLLELWWHQMAGGSNLNIYFDDMQILRVGSSNSIPDKLISTMTSASNPITAATLFVNGSFPTNTAGSFFLSTNSGTTWEAVNLGSVVNGSVFGTQGSGIVFRADLYSTNGVAVPKIYEYGLQWSEE